MKREHIYLSTTAGDASAVARRHRLGIEIAEYCTAWNMDDAFAETHEEVKNKLEGISRTVFHAPFNELFPCAIDRKARALAAHRYRQAIALAKGYGAGKIVIHGGYNPFIYYPVWYVEQSILFWKDFLREDPGMDIVLENVLEETPDMLAEIIRGADHPRLRMCLDVGHVNAYSKVPALEWLAQCAPYIGHFHIHNNDGTVDAHRPLMEGSLPMAELLTRGAQLCPQATFTLEVMEADASVRWLEANRLI